RVPRPGGDVAQVGLGGHAAEDHLGGGGGQDRLGALGPVPVAQLGQGLGRPQRDDAPAPALGDQRGQGLQRGDVGDLVQREQQRLDQPAALGGSAFGGALGDGIDQTDDQGRDGLLHVAGPDDEQGRVGGQELIDVQLDGVGGGQHPGFGRGLQATPRD